MAYTLAKNGDREEQKYWATFLRDEFSAYETVWVAYIVPLTGRPDHVYFKTDTELTAIGRGHADLCNAQLHYTTLIHLGRAWELRQGRVATVEAFTEAITRLSAATDVADELLQRAVSPGTYDAWKESASARRAWRKATGSPLQPLRDYRNRLLHGRIPPVVGVRGLLPDGEALFVPKIGCEASYLDWRQILGQPTPTFRACVRADFAWIDEVVQDAWAEVLAYLQQRWTDTLVPAFT